MIGTRTLDSGLAFLRGKRLSSAAGSYLDYRISLLLGRPFLKNYPPALMIEPTNHCNLKCPLCPSGNGTLNRKRGMMGIDLYQKILNQVEPYVGMLILWNQGEPFLNPNFYQMLELANEKRFYTMTSTNASLPLDNERIIRSGLNKIIVSMDGISQNTYDTYRINGDYQQVLFNLQELVQLKNKFRNKHLLVVWQFIIMHHNEHEIDSVRRLAKRIGVDKLEFKTAQIYTKDDIRFLPSSHKYSRYLYNESNFQLRTKLLNRCRRLWTQPVINWDGEFAVCCYDKDCSITIGNIQEQDFSELWIGQKMMRFRELVLKSRSTIPICQNCGEGIIQKIHL